jgi:cytochrome P450
VIRLGLAAGNSDPSVFAEPRRFDPGRRDLRGAESRGSIRTDVQASHLAVGVGSHFCPGYRLARLEALVGVRALLERRGPPRPTSGHPPALRIHKLHLTVPALHVAFD